MASMTKQRYTSFFKMNIWQRFMEKLKIMAEEAKQSRMVARQQREAVRAVERKAYHDERLKVAVTEGQARARQPRGMAGLSSGLQTLSKNLGKIAPPSTNKYKGQTMTDFISGSSTKSKGTTMMDVKF